jgi:hypothetical protein
MKKLFIIILTSILLFSCALESKYDLINDQTIDNELIGKWSTEKNKGAIAFEKNNDNTIKIIIINDKKANEVISKAAFTKTINGHHFINLVSDKNKEGKVINMFYEYKIVGKTFKYREVDSDFTKQKFNSSKELLNFFKDNMDKDGFFGKYDEELTKS